MESINKDEIIKIVKDYYISKSDENKQDIEVDLKRVGGLSNWNYVCTIKDNDKETKVIFRKFGEGSDCVDYELETNIIEKLSKEGLGPKILKQNVSKKYRISEFLENTETIPKDKQFSNELINQLQVALSIYNNFSSMYKFEIKDDIIHTSLCSFENKNNKKLQLQKTIYNQIVDMFLPVAQKRFNIFKEKFFKCDKVCQNSIELDKLKKVEYYLDNIKKLIKEEMGTNGFFILNHNDIHRLNLLIRNSDNKLFIIDNENAFLSLPGHDFANYCNESYFSYEPEYKTFFNEIDYDKTYLLFSVYINLFINSHKEMKQDPLGNRIINQIQTKNYFISLHNIVNLYWFLWSIIYIDFDAWKKDELAEYYYIHGLDRIKIYEIGKNALAQN